MITATHDGSGGVRLHDDDGAFARVKPADRHRLRRALAGDGCTRAVLMPSGVITVTERHGSEVKLLTRDGKPRTGEGSDRTAIAARDYLLTEVERLLTWIEDDARLSSGDGMHLTAIVSEWRAPLLAGYDLGDRKGAS